MTQLTDRPRLATEVELVAPVDAHEGPTYVAEEDALYFTTLPRRTGGAPLVAIRRLALDGDRFPLAPERVSTVVADANVANGMTIDADGALVVCEQGSLEADAAITRIDRVTGVREVVVDSFASRRLSSPNDVVVKSDGTIWFTDPSYGHLQGFRPEPETADAVYRYDPRDGRLSVAADSLDKPNGLAFSPGETELYVGDSSANQEPGSFHTDRPHRVRAFDVVHSDRLAAERAFADIEPGFPDGIKVDSEGRVYVSSFSGVQVFAPGGEPLGQIDLPGCVNFTFGGPAGDLLFVTTDDAIWAARLEATGPPTRREPEPWPL